ncbi:MAG: hypothetical protein ACREVD_14270 [Burkholderiales bacterium]
MPFRNDLLWQLLFQFFITMVLVFAAVGFAAGIGLIVSSARTLRFFAVMNRWVSTRGVLRAMEVPRSTEHISHRNRRLIGGALIAGGVFATFGLLVGVNAAAFSALVAKGDMRVVVAIVAGTVKWFLVIGSVTGVLVGYLLGFAPEALRRLEKHANRWFSTRRAVRGGDDLHMILDTLVEAHPRPSGWILVCTGLGAVVYAATLLFARG